MKKENKSKVETENKAVSTITETAKEEKEIKVNQDKVGSLMHEARLKKGLKIADAARDLCIRAAYLEAIEAGNYDEIPAPPYGIGFIRSYAGYLGLNAARMVQLFKEETEALTKSNSYYVIEPQTEVTAPNRKYLLISLTAIFAVYLGWFMFNESRDNSVEDISLSNEYSTDAQESTVDFPLQVEDFASVEENTTDTSADVEKQPVVDVVSVSETAGDNITISEASFVETGAGNEQSSDVLVKKSTEKVTSASSEAEVKKPAVGVMGKKPGSRVSVKIKGGDTWLEVRDAGKLYISKVLHAGDVYDVPAGGGMIISIGRADGADVFIDGKLTEVFKPTKKTGIALDPFLEAANH